MKIYLAGPMTGYPDYNFPAFDAERDRLRALGHDVVSPADISREMDAAAGVEQGDLDWDEYMEADLKAMATCDAVRLLPGWWHSRGAIMERDRAISLGLMLLDSMTIGEIE